MPESECYFTLKGRFPLTKRELSDRIGRLALQNIGCTTEYGTPSVDRSLTVPTGA